MPSGSPRARAGDGFDNDKDDDDDDDVQPSPARPSSAPSATNPEADPDDDPSTGDDGFVPATVAIAVHAPCLPRAMPRDDEEGAEIAALAITAPANALGFKEISPWSLGSINHQQSNPSNSENTRL